MDTKMDYKKMNTQELLSLISEQVINEEINENHKLIIQDVLKELFVKKCSRYKKISYQKLRNLPDRYECPLFKDANHDCDVFTHPKLKCDCRENCVSNNMEITWHTCICEVRGSYSSFIPFRSVIGDRPVKMFEDNGFYVEDFAGYNLNIMKIEDIEH